MKFRQFALALAFSTSCYSQFFGLATPADGSQVYFATPLRQKDTTQPDYGKIFRVDANGLTLQESRLYQAPPVSSGGLVLSNAYDLQFPDISSDGRVTAMAAARECYAAYALCAKSDIAQLTTITTPRGSQDYPGQLHLSANGNWALGGNGLPHYSVLFGRLVNVLTGEQVTFSTAAVAEGRFQVGFSGRPIANDGTAVFSDQNAVVILRGSQVLRRIPMPDAEEPWDAVIDPGAQTVVYASSSLQFDASSSLQAAAVATGVITILAADGSAPVISDDGQTVLYLSSRSGAPQLWLIQVDGSHDRQLTQDPLGIKRAILSGDASTVYADTLGGELLKIDSVTGATHKLIPRTPFIDATTTSIAPGIVAKFIGEGLVNPITASVEGKPALTLDVEPTSIRILTPSDLTPAQYPSPFQDVRSPVGLLALTLDSPSPFAAPSIPLSITAQAPSFLYTTGNNIEAAHQDWSSLVTPDAPAHPGEVIHAYTTGLDLSSPYTCPTLTLLFAGPAPGFPGVYQLDLQIPPDATAGTPVIGCYHGFSNIFGRIPLAP